MRKTLLAILLAVALALIPVGSAFAANSDTVTVTATPGFVSITVTPDTYDFAVVYPDTDEDTVAGTPFTVNNSSTVDMDLTIECDGWTGGPGWTYADTAGIDTGSLNFSTNDGVLWTYLPETPTTAVLASDVTPATSPTFDLQLDAPTDFTYGDVQTTTVTVTAAPS